MELLGFRLDNLSLMALTVATGFVVDDAIVVLENISRHIEPGMGRVRGGAARRHGGRLHRRLDRVWLIAVFIPLLFMGGQSAGCSASSRSPCRGGDDLAGDVADHDADACAWLLRPAGRAASGSRANSRGSAEAASSGSSGGMRAPRLVAASTSAGAVILFVRSASTSASTSSSRRASSRSRTPASCRAGCAPTRRSASGIRGKLSQIVNIVRHDPAVDTVVGFTGGSRAGGGFLFVTLKPKSSARDSGRRSSRGCAPSCARDRRATSSTRCRTSGSAAANPTPVINTR